VRQFSEFYKSKNNKSGLSSECKICGREIDKKYSLENKEKIKEYYQENKEKNKEYYQENKEKLKEYRLKYKLENKEKLKEYFKKYNLENKEKRNKRDTIRRKTEPLYKLKNNVKSRITMALREFGYRKKSKTEQLLGCSVQQLKEHLEKQFTTGMNWQNHGQYGWHIDHIIPLSSAKTQEDLHRLCHYTNLQPLWWHVNLSKSDKILSR
jgi:hypothetical protein